MASEGKGDTELFNRECARLIGEISSNFEGLLNEANKLNQKKEDLRSASGEVSTVAYLWSHFHDLMKQHREEAPNLSKSVGGGYVGSGGYVAGGERRS